MNLPKTKPEDNYINVKKQSQNIMPKANIIQFYLKYRLILYAIVCGVHKNF